MAVYSSTALEAGAAAAPVQCYVDEIVGTNTSAGVLYLQVFDSATVPADTADPIISIAVPATSTVSWDPRGDKGYSYTNGCAVCFSSTAHTKTVAGAIGTFHVRYEPK